MNFWHSNLTTIERGALGVFSSIGSVWFSAFSGAEIYIRVGGLMIGVLVGVATLFSVLLDICRKLKDRK